MGRMHNRLALWIISSLAISIAAFIAGGVTLGGIGHILWYGGAHNALLFASFIFSIAWLTIFILSFVFCRWRGLWLLVGAPGAVFWPAVILGMTLAISACVANHPADANMSCFP
jgi:hypothetical protein